MNYRLNFKEVLELKLPVISSQIGNDDFEIKQIHFDTRKIHTAQNSLFIAFETSNNDGNKFIAEAYQKGVRNFIVNKTLDFPDVNFIQVENSLDFLQKIAEKHRQKFNYPLIAITGSNGKTVVKEWLVSFLEDDFKIVKSPKSYNSQIGVPLSILLMKEEHDLAIIEVGISQPNEMTKLAQIVQADFGVFTHFGDAHQANFVNFSQKLSEKALLFQKSQAVFFDYDDSELVNHHFEKLKFKSKSVSKKNENSDLFYQLKSAENSFQNIEFYEKSEQFEAKIPFSDKASISNATLSILIARFFKVSWQKIIQKAEKLHSVSMRTEILTNNPEICVVNDVYNADASSIYNSFSLLQNSTPFDRKIVILSEIEHLGKEKEQIHLEIVQSAAKLFGEENLYLLGKIYQEYQEDFLESHFLESAEELKSKFVYSKFKNASVLLKAARKYRFEQLLPLFLRNEHRTYLEINLNKLIDNLNAFKKNLKPTTKIMLMLKAFSYGAGSWEIAKILEKEHVDYIAVAFLSEGIRLRQAGIDLPILVLNVGQHELSLLSEWNLEPEISDFETLFDYIRLSKYSNEEELKLHIKIDTGMNRFGFQDSDLPKLKSVLEQNSLRVTSIFTHLAAADDENSDEYTRLQLKKFEKAIKFLGNTVKNAIKHCLNTAGIVRFPEFQMDMVRLGIGLYGVSPVRTNLELQEISRLVTKIVQIKDAKKGTRLSYGNFVLESNKRIGILPIGYADGLHRIFSDGNLSVLVNEKLVEIIGKICMDITLIDLSNYPDTKLGDEVVIFGEQGKSFQSVKKLAKKAGTIPYEILSGISERVKRIYIRE